MNQDKDITYQYKFDELRLAITHPHSLKIAYVLVEGSSDERLFRKLFNSDYCKVEWVPGGNPKLELCVNDLLPFHNLIFGIRDADFINLNKIDYTKQNIFLTDLHDIEMSMIAENEVFSAVLHEYLPILPKNKHQEVRNDVFKILEKLSLLKWLNDIEFLELPFEFGFQDLISINNMEIEFEKYITRLNSELKKVGKQPIELSFEKLENLKKSKPDIFQLTNGHDFLKTLSEFLRKRGNAKDLKYDDLASNFRINYSISHFNRTQLYNKIKEWEVSNSCVLFIHFK
ncbi:MAG: hypothetical protein EAZ53_12830 [Bacteroidetes bacterium]|nr:MAG: hypothetical protein EAZ53_12830 [Bacteroidota bacterium]